MIRDPQTPAEWQQAADAADTLLRMEAARAYGLVQGGPVVDAERAAELLTRARRKGFHPHPEALTRMVAELTKRSDRYITQQELCRDYNIGRTKLFELRQAGGFPKVVSRRGKKVLFLRAAVEDWFRRQESK